MVRLLWEVRRQDPQAISSAKDPVNVDVEKIRLAFAGGIEVAGD